MSRDSAGLSARLLPLCVLVAAVGGCGSSGGGSGGTITNLPPPSGWVAGLFLPAASFAGKCVAPRSGTDPATGAPYIDVKGTRVDENNWLRSWSNDLYLWYDEILDRDPGLYLTEQYFILLKTEQRTPSGTPKDRFHFTYPTDQWQALLQSGIEAGYGAIWSLVESQPPRRLVVAYTQPNSPATAPAANLQRGEEILAVDDHDVVHSTSQTAVAGFLAGLFPAQFDEEHTFRVRNPQTGRERTITMRSAAVAIDPVQNAKVVPTLTGNVGYMLFTDHLPIAEQELIDTFAMFLAQNVTDLVLDIRYNGGGALALASEVAYMIAGDVPTAGQPFERLVFNDKHRSINPFTGGPLEPMPFFNGSSQGQRLPALNLRRVYVLTGSSTCSASESIMNGLRGVGVEVIQVGSTTCGKPYGFVPQDNCGTTYFTIQMQGVNAAGFGDYGDGFTPNNAPVPGGVRLPGCAVHDDFSKPLGDPAEARFKAALDLRDGGTCPVPSAAKPSFTKPANGAGGATSDGELRKSPWLMNRWLDAL